MRGTPTGALTAVHRNTEKTAAITSHHFRAEKCGALADIPTELQF